MATVGGSYEHQLAALLHDIGHFAFSHTVDYLVDNRDENAHEFETTTRLPDVEDIDRVTGRGVLDYARVRDAVVDAPQWLRQVDKIDYVLRDLGNAGLISPREAVAVICALEFDGDLLYFTDREIAGRFCELLQRSVEMLYMSPVDLYQHSVLAGIVREAMEEGLLEFEALRETDRDILRTLSSIERIGRRLVEAITADPADLRESKQRMFSKNRLYEPYVKVATNEIVPLSHCDRQWTMYCKRAVIAAEMGVPKLRYRW